MLRVPNGEKVKSVSTAPKQSPAVQSMPKPVVQSEPKPIVQVVPKPNVESVSKLSVSKSMNSAGSASVPNQSANNALNLVLRKDQVSVERDNTSVPNASSGNGDNNKAIPKVSAVKPPDTKLRVQEDNLQRSTRVRIPNMKYLDISSILTSISFWSPNPSYRSDIYTT